MKRVGVVSGMEMCSGAVNWRYFAVAKLRSTEEADVASRLVVGMIESFEAIACRRRRRGSCCEPVVAILM